MKQTAELKLKKQSRSEKEVLITSDIAVKTSESTTFGTRVSAFVPKADTTKPMPKIAVTVSVGHDSIRLVADNTDDLWDYFAQICATLDKNSNILDKGLEKARSSYMDQLNAKYDGIKSKKPRVISLKQG